MLILLNVLEKLMSCRIEATVAKEMTYKDPYANEFAVVELTTQLKAYIHDLDPSIEFNNKDFFASSDYSKEKERITYTLRWLPQTRMCVFYSGLVHGRVVDCGNQFPGRITINSEPGTSAPTKQIDYKLNGWDTVNRWWIYTPVE